MIYQMHRLLDPDSGSNKTELVLHFKDASHAWEAYVELVDKDPSAFISHIVVEFDGEETYGTIMKEPPWVIYHFGNIH